MSSHFDSEVDYRNSERERTDCKGKTSEQHIADMIQADLGVAIDSQALRMFIRHRFDRLSVLTHRIHDGKR
jgi:hypothetical protein